MKITIVGTGYVGMSLAVLISQHYSVTALDIDKKKIDLINKKISPIKDDEIKNYLDSKHLKLKATSDKILAYKNARYIIVATPTNYDAKINSFDTKSVEKVIKDAISINKRATIVIKSTVPYGFTKKIRKKLKTERIFFSPEFLRESKALYDNLYPSRIVIGDVSADGRKFANILSKCAIKDKSEIPVLLMKSSEAESVKLFSNTFLALRIAFFNELDSFSETNNLSTEDIINGVSCDPRIGNYYNNPSFGYGGYCLPKDTKQLLNNYKEIPNKLIKAVVESNQTRKNYIVESIISKKPKLVGVYRLIMKEGSDNFRESAVSDILSQLTKRNIKIIIFEPFISSDRFNNIEVEKELTNFIDRSDIIIANRYSDDIKHVMHKVYSRDIYREN